MDNNTENISKEDLQKIFDTLDTPEKIVEQIRYMHWDMSCCNCWVCRCAREIEVRTIRHVRHAPDVGTQLVVEEED